MRVGKEAGSPSATVTTGEPSSSVLKSAAECPVRVEYRVLSSSLVSGAKTKDYGSGAQTLD